MLSPSSFLAMSLILASVTLASSPYNFWSPHGDQKFFSMCFSVPRENATPPFQAAKRPGSKGRRAGLGSASEATWKPSKSPESCRCLGCQPAATGPQSAGAGGHSRGGRTPLVLLSRQPTHGCGGARCRYPGSACPGTCRTNPAPGAGLLASPLRVRIARP